MNLDWLGWSLWCHQKTNCHPLTTFLGDSSYLSHTRLHVHQNLRNTQFKRSPVNKSIGNAFGEHVQGELLLPLASLFPGAALLGTGKGTLEPLHQEIKLNTKQKQK